MSTITLITGNAGKAKEVSQYLGLEVDRISLDLQEIQSLKLEEIVRDKAMRAYEEVQRPVLVEDVAFTFHSLGKLPGTLVKWFEKELGNDGLCRMVDGKDRSCTATVLYGYHDGKEVHLFEGEMAGQVADLPRGSNSFGWASIFVPEGMNKTYAELTDEEQSAVAMRKKALEKLHSFLSSQLP